MPVPLQRNNANRRNEYVNMPVSLQSVSSHPMPAVSTDIQSVSSASPDLSNPHGPPFGGGVSRNINGAAGGGAAPPLPPHNYANMPVNKNPLPPPRNDDQRYTSKFNRYVLLKLISREIFFPKTLLFINVFQIFVECL